MIDKLFKYIFNVENLKTNGLIIVLLATLYILQKILTNDFAHVEKVIEKNNEALLQQAVSNTKLGNSVEKLSEIIDKKIK